MRTVDSVDPLGDNGASEGCETLNNVTFGHSMSEISRQGSNRWCHLYDFPQDVWGGWMFSSQAV